MYSYDNIELVDLSYKACTLIAIASAQRMQTISLIKLRNISKHDHEIFIKISDLIKTSKPGASDCPLFTKTPVFVRHWQLKHTLKRPEICDLICLTNTVCWSPQTS